MASTVNIVSQFRSLIPLQLHPLILQSPRFLSKSPLHRLQNLRSQSSTTLSIFASAAKLAADVEFLEKSSESLSKWGEFAGNVSGEWDGFGAEFTSDGKPIELPESVVPEAFREWCVQVFDWQIQCPTLAELEEPLVLYKLIKLLPTVGCEADAATRFSVDERNVGGVNNKVSAFAFHPSGCYVAIWSVEDQESYQLLELEHCLVDPRNRESRVRLVQVVRVEKTMMKLQTVKVFCEQWYGPFRNGEQLGGCTIRDSAFASTDALKDTEVMGVWQGTTTIASFQSSQKDVIQQLAVDKPRKTVRDQHGLILLPKQLWCSVKESDGGEFWGEVGWLLDHGHALTSACVFSKDGKLKEIAIAHETSVQEEM